MPAPWSPRPTRLLLGYAALGATLPYLVLKLLWTLRIPVGVTDAGQAAFADSGVMVAVNAVTLVMDAVAAGLALSFAHRWGLRVAAWVILTPMWMATGFLVPITIAAGPGAVLAASAAPSGAGVAHYLEGWVPVVIGGGFALQGALLTAAFVLYVRARWRLTPPPIDEVVARSVLVPLAVLSATLAGLASAGHLAVLFGDLRSGGVRTGTIEALHVAWAAGGLAAVTGARQLLWPRASRRRWSGPVLAWVGSSTLFAWGLWSVGTVLAVPGEGDPWVGPLGLAKLLAGLLLGVIALVVLAGGAGSVRDVAR